MEFYSTHTTQWKFGAWHMDWSIDIFTTLPHWYLSFFNFHSSENVVVIYLVLIVDYLKLEPWTQNLWFLDDSGWIKQIPSSMVHLAKWPYFLVDYVMEIMQVLVVILFIHDSNNTYEIHISMRSIWPSPLEKRRNPIIDVQTHYL